MANPSDRRRGRRPPRSTLFVRWLAVGGMLLVALLYYRPLLTYVEARHSLTSRSAEVTALRREKQALERRLSHSVAADALVREARRLGYVQRGERLFIVKGIEAWKRLRSTIKRNG